MPDVRCAVADPDCDQDAKGDPDAHGYNVALHTGGAMQAGGDIRGKLWKMRPWEDELWQMAIGGDDEQNQD